MFKSGRDFYEKIKNCERKQTFLTTYEYTSVLNLLK